MRVLWRQGRDWWVGEVERGSVAAAATKTKQRNESGKLLREENDEGKQYEREPALVGHY